MTTSDEDGNENPQVRIIREEQQRGSIHLHVLWTRICMRVPPSALPVTRLHIRARFPQVMHVVNRILHIQAAAQPPTPADKLAMAHAAQQKWPRKATAV